eukprot:486952-Rhodomonas_salina.2
MTERDLCQFWACRRKGSMSAPDVIAQGNYLLLDSRRSKIMLCCCTKRLTWAPRTLSQSRTLKSKRNRQVGPGNRTASMRKGS